LRCDGLSHISSKKLLLDRFSPAARKKFLTELNEQYPFPANRFKKPAPISEGFCFEQTGREQSFADLFEAWKRTAENPVRSRAALVTTPSQTGTGKSRFAVLAASKGVMFDQLDKEWEAAMKGFKDEDFKAGLREAVGVTVTFNYATEVDGKEAFEHMIGVRMLIAISIEEFQDFL